MRRYRVYECQLETQVAKFSYAVEAETPKAAIEAAQSGDADPCNDGYMGEPDYGESGWSARPLPAVGAPDHPESWKTDVDAFAEAALDMDAESATSTLLAVLQRLRIEACHYRTTGVGSVHLIDAENHALAVMEGVLGATQNSKAFREAVDRLARRPAPIEPKPAV